MAEGAGPIRRILIPFLCIGITVLGLNNVYGSDEVEKLAEQTACGKENCAVMKLEVSRNPFSHRYVYQTSREQQTRAAVKCAREYIFIGDYRCERQ